MISKSVINEIKFLVILLLIIPFALSLFSYFSIGQSCECEYGDVISNNCPSGFLATCINEFDCVCKCGTKTSCNDNNECTLDYCFEDSCQNPLTFSAKQCQDHGGTCNPTTGSCDSNWPECNPSQSCCDSTGHYYPDGTVCFESNPQCNGKCAMEIKVNRCYSGSCDMSAFSWDFSHYTPTGEVCINAGPASREVFLSCSNFCSSSDNFCSDSNTVSKRVFGCDGKGSCSNLNGLVCPVKTCMPGEQCKDGECVPCKCSSGACCDGCNYYGTEHVCSSSSVCGG
ncbi:MAG TPA: hypothetical protein PLX15_05515, partial [Candidatus Woesearchaeota archaeon]|nr:hypothetical protein [Candidatus Woesearchaeota archaeon]